VLAWGRGGGVRALRLAAPAAEYKIFTLPTSKNYFFGEKKLVMRGWLSGTVTLAFFFALSAAAAAAAAAAALVIILGGSNPLASKSSAPPSLHGLG
jgi:hypothetical protein